MKKWLPRIGVLLGLLLILFVIARITGILQWYLPPTAANAPELPFGKSFFTSIVVKPERYDFICFNTVSPEFGKHVAVYRLCGLPGDQVEIKNDVLYVNGTKPNKEFAILQPYRMRVGDYNEEWTLPGLEPDPAGTDSLNVWFDSVTVAANNIKAVRVTEPESSLSEVVAKRWGKPWTPSNFGPVTVPSDSYFLLGDNRWGANDSRFTGFIKTSDWVGTVLGH